MVWYGMRSYIMGVDFIFFFWGGGEGIFISYAQTSFLFQMGYPAFRHFEGILIMENVEFAIAGAILDARENQSGAIFRIKNPQNRLQAGYRWVTAWYFVFCSR